MSKFLRQDLFFWIGYQSIDVSGKADELKELLGAKVYEVITKDAQHAMLRNKTENVYISCTPTSLLVRVPVKDELLEDESDAHKRELLTEIVERLMSPSFLPQQFQTVTVSLTSIFLPVDEGTPEGTRAVVQHALEKLTHRRIKNIDTVKLCIEIGNKQTRYSAVSDDKTGQYAMSVEVGKRLVKERGLDRQDVVDAARHTRIFADLQKEYETLLPLV